MFSTRFARAWCVRLSIVALATGCAGQSTQKPSSDGGPDLKGDIVRIDIAPADLPRCLTEAGTPCVSMSCGNGVLNTPEEDCDDGDKDSGDGCSATCHTETDWVCLEPGKPCESTVSCGDGRISGAETCDDTNATGGDGCSDTCQIEDGWICPAPGHRCVPKCGDDQLVGWEQCEDGGNTSGDGCTDTCRTEPGWVCPLLGSPCSKTVCGDGTKEGDETCDDGNKVSGDGCSSMCMTEPVCSGTSGCTSSCGDGLRLPSEDCDDGNNSDGDGCTFDCKLEPNWDCKDRSNGDDSELVVPVVYRDFIRHDAAGGHPDFELAVSACMGMVKSTLVNKKPELASPPPSAGTCGVKDATSFSQWYSDSSFAKTIVDTMTLTKQPDGSFVFDNSASASWPGGTFTWVHPPFFPLDNRGWADPTRATPETQYTSDYGQPQLHNFSFTSEVRYWFEYQGGEALEFIGDDDVWVFVNGRLAVDIGGVHGPQTGYLTLDATKASSLGLSKGNIYEIAVFQAERHVTGSSYKLTLGKFQMKRTVCTPVCGDGIVNGTELCDDGVNDGAYGGCMPGCQAVAPYCGDKQIDPDHESCDNGVNMTGYGQSGCAPGCRAVPYCGDMNIDSLWGESCDDGNNTDGDGCSADCHIEIG